MPSFLWTQHKARLTFVSAHDGNTYNWIFLPGGPGLGSEYLSNLTLNLSLPGTIWHLDLPGDGSNIDDSSAFKNWKIGLLEAVSSLKNVILVAHSTGGMYALSTPEIEQHLSGLILISSAPDASWQEHFMAYVTHHPLKTVDSLQQAYEQTQTNELLKKLTIASAPYFLTPENMMEKIYSFESLPFNHQAHDWSAQYFDTTYAHQWVPKEIPTLIIGGNLDKITPLRLFSLNRHFTRRNIVMQGISNAAHFPWLDNQEETLSAIEGYGRFLKN